MILERILSNMIKTDLSADTLAMCSSGGGHGLFLTTLTSCNHCQPCDVFLVQTEIHRRLSHDKPSIISSIAMYNQGDFMFLCNILQHWVTFFALGPTLVQRLVFGLISFERELLAIELFCSECNIPILVMVKK